MYSVDVYLRLGRAMMVEGMSVREAASTFGLHRVPVRKILECSVPPGYRRQVPPRRPKLSPYTGVIDRILEDDHQVPRKQRHTAKRIYERLRDEYGLDCGYTIVKDYVWEHRRQTREMFVPLSHPSGHAQLPQETLGKVDPRLRDPNGRWIGTSGRARTIIYNTDTVNPETDLPDSILDFTSEEWKGRVGWAPWNGSFQAFVTALRLTEGDDAAREWLEGMKDNDARDYPNNVSIVLATANGEVDVGFVNHYYLERFLEEHGTGFKARNYYIGYGDPGALVLVAGAGILEASDNKHTAMEFIEFLLSEPAQQYFTSDIKEYPVAAGVVPVGDLPPIESLNPPNVDLGNLTDLEGTLDLLRDVGVVP